MRYIGYKLASHKFNPFHICYILKTYYLTKTRFFIHHFRLLNFNIPFNRMKYCYFLIIIFCIH